MPGNANVTTATNDRARVYADTATRSIITFYRQSGFPVVAPQVSGSIFASPATGPATTPSFRQITGGDADSVLISSLTVSSAVTSAVIFNTSNADLSSFDRYEIHLVKVLPDTNGTLLQAQLSTSGGAGFNTGATEYQTALVAYDMTGATSTAFSSAIGNLRMADTQSAINNAKGAGWSGKLTMHSRQL